MNSGRAAAVFHVYDRKHLEHVPRRYTVEPDKQLTGEWDLVDDDGAYDLWVLGPNGYHRHFTGSTTQAIEAGIVPEIEVSYDAANGGVTVAISNAGDIAASVMIRENAYAERESAFTVADRSEKRETYELDDSGTWYDFTVTVAELPGFRRRFAGRVETGAHGISDPALGGPAIGEQLALVEHAPATHSLKRRRRHWHLVEGQGDVPAGEVPGGPRLGPAKP